jgi:hypothetical protein
VPYNGRMHVFEIVEALNEVPGIEVKVRRGSLNVHVPALGDTVELNPDEVVEIDHVWVPTGEPAVQLDLKRGREILPLIITTGDVVFTPAYADDLIAPGAGRFVPAMPSLISYSEMHRDVRAFGRTIDDPAADLDPMMLAATLLAHRCFLYGAVRAGLWPVRVAAWWEYANSRLDGTVPLAPIRPDPIWDELMADVAEARRQGEQDQ